MLKKTIIGIVALLVVCGLFFVSKDSFKKGNTDKTNDAKVAIEKNTTESKKVATDLSKPFFEKMKLTQEQMKKHNDTLAKIGDLTKSLSEKRDAKSVEYIQVSTSGLSEAEKKEKMDKINEEINDLNRQCDAVYDKTIVEFSSVLKPEQKKEWDSYQALVVKKFRNYK